jgi:hypothetical protein
MRRSLRYAWLPLIAVALFGSEVQAQQKNGFDLADSLLPSKEIRRGGPPRDGIPAVYAPKFVRADAQDDLDEGARVLGVFVGGIAKAFPVTILEHHEVVNDWTQETHMVVTYCPLCGSGMVFRSGEDGKAVFGVSGLLYNSDVLLYDHETESLWSQILGMAVTGPKRGEELGSIPVVHTNWASWLERHPDTYVMTRETGYSGIDYRSGPDAYKGYERSRRIWFPVANKDKRYHPKAWILGIQLDGITKAYPFEELARTEGIVHDRLGDTAIVVHYDGDSAWAEDEAGQLLPAVRLFWFAWIGFHPDTRVFTVTD